MITAIDRHHGYAAYAALVFCFCRACLCFYNFASSGTKITAQQPKEMNVI